LYSAALPLAQLGPPGVYGLHWIAASLECEGRALADEELAVATLAARAMAAIKEKIGRMEFPLRQFFFMTSSPSVCLLPEAARSHDL